MCAVLVKVGMAEHPLYFTACMVGKYDVDSMPKQLLLLTAMHELLMRYQRQAQCHYQAVPVWQADVM